MSPIFQMFEGQRPLEKVNRMGMGSVRRNERELTSAHFKEGLRESRNRAHVDRDRPVGRSVQGKCLLVLQL